LPDGVIAFGYTLSSDGSVTDCFGTPKTITITGLTTTNPLPGSVTIRSDSGSSFNLPGAVEPEDFSSPPLYMLDSSLNNQRIAVIDLQTQTITTQIPLPQAIYSGSAMAVAPDGSFLYVTKRKPQLSVTTLPPSIVVVNLITNKVEAEIALPSTLTPQGGIAITPDGKFVYVPVADTPQVTTNYLVYVVDTAARKVSATIALPNGASPSHIAMTPDGRSVYVAVQAPSQGALSLGMVAIDVLSNSVSANILFPGATALNRLVMDPSGRYVYATNKGPNIAIVDAITNRYVDQIKVAPMVSGSTSLRISGDGRLLYSIDQGDPFVNVIDTSARAVVSRTQVASFPAGAGWALFDVVPLP
jgi:DNA-binding beta-propeller fold protein YncE